MVCHCYLLNLSQPLQLCPQVHLLRLCLYSCLANRFISIIFLDSIHICVNIWYLFFSFWLTSFCVTGSRSIHFITAAKSLQSCPILCDSIDSSPPGSPIPGILQTRTLEWVAITFSNAWKWKVKVMSLSRVWLLLQLNQICSFLWLIVHCIHTPQFLYSFICCWTSGLLPCPGYCK